MWRSWTASVNFCREIGANIITIKDETDQAYITAHNVNLQHSGVSGYWIGMEIDSKGHPIWADGTSVYYDEFQEDASKDPGSCVLAKTTSGHNNWDTIGCNEQHPFICTASVGARIKIPDDINADYRCDEGWHYFKDQMFNENCYKITRNPQETFDLVFIHSV